MATNFTSTASYSIRFIYLMLSSRCSLSLKLLLRLPPASLDSWTHHLLPRLITGFVKLQSSSETTSAPSSRPPWDSWPHHLMPRLVTGLVKLQPFSEMTSAPSSCLLGLLASPLNVQVIYGFQKIQSAPYLLRPHLPKRMARLNLTSETKQTESLIEV